MCRAGREGPRTPSSTTDANLDYAFVENALVTPILDFETETRTPYRCAALGGGRGMPSTTAETNLDYAFVENALFLTILDFEKST